MIAVKSLGELVMRHRAARICVMGGGPSLADEIASVKADVWISCNEHGAKLRGVDYVVAMDNLHTLHRDPMQARIRQYTDAPIIGPWHWNDYGITNYPLSPKLIFTGVIATWVASMMGANPVILAGFDCTDNARRSLSQFGEFKPHVKSAVRVVGGPLGELWPVYDPAEEFATYDPPEVLDEIAMDHGITVRVLKPVEVRGQEYPIGTVLRVPLAEVWRQIKHRSLVEVPQAPKPKARRRSTQKGEVCTA